MISNSPDDYDEQNWYTDGGAWYAEPEDDEWMICPVCDGLGTDNWDEEKLCQRCMGQGEVLTS
jgi:hypothetical protein